MADSIRSELGALTRRRIVLAQSRTSARVLAALPVGFGAALSLFSDDPVYSGLVGVVSVTLGLALNAAGLYWMHVLTGRIAMTLPSRLPAVQRSPAAADRATPSRDAVTAKVSNREDEC